MKLQLIKGFLWVRYEIFDNKNLNSSDMLVYMGLMRYMDNQTCTCFPSLTKMEEMTGLTRKTVYKSLTHLEEEGLVAISKKGGKVNQYLMLEPKQGKNSSSNRGNEQSALGEISTTNNTKRNNTKIYVTLLNYKKPIEVLNNMTGRSFKADNLTYLGEIRARVKEGSPIEEICEVVKFICKERMGTEWEKFLRPSTVFNKTKYESYVAEYRYLTKDGKYAILYKKKGLSVLKDLA